MRTILLALLVSALLLPFAACGSSSSHVRRCPNSPHVPCLTGEECTIDAARGCEMCRCAEPYGVREQQPDPIGPASPQ
jgi:hypothetical protein